MPAKPLTPAQHEDAARLRARFRAWQEDRKLHNKPSSQMEAAEQLGFGQSALSQYLRGDIPLNINVLPKFTMLLGCRYDEISPALAAKINAFVSNADFAVFDEQAGKWFVAETKGHHISANEAETEEVVNTSNERLGTGVNHALREIAQQFVTDLMDAVQEGRVSEELVRLLSGMLHAGAPARARGDQERKEKIAVAKHGRRSTKRGTGT